MRFDFFSTRADAHIRRAQEYLQQAHLARIEHQTAAEHHAALAAMYSQRVQWLEREVADATNGSQATPARGATPKTIEAVKRVPESIFALTRSQRPVVEGLG
jgi:hypothetical protein